MKRINRIKAVLAETGNTGKWLADQVGRDKATVSKWCTNAIQPDLLMLSKIAEVLRVNIRDLLVDSEPSKE
jgi:Helix-turn-helix.